MKIKNKIFITISLVSIICFLGLILYFILPKTSYGFYSNIDELISQNKSFTMTNFKNVGDIFYIELRVAQTTRYTVLGVFDDNIEIFSKDPRVKNYSITRVSHPFGIAEPIEKIGKVEILKNYHIESIGDQGYQFVDGNGKIVDNINYITGSIGLGEYQIYLEPENKYFILNLYKR